MNHMPFVLEMFRHVSRKMSFKPERPRHEVLLSLHFGRPRSSGGSSPRTLTTLGTET